MKLSILLKRFFYLCTIVACSSCEIFAEGGVCFNITNNTDLNLDFVECYKVYDEAYTLEDLIPGSYFHVCYKDHSCWMSNYSTNGWTGWKKNWDYVLDHRLSYYIMVLDDSIGRNLVGDRTNGILSADRVDFFSTDMVIALMVIREDDFKDLVNKNSCPEFTFPPDQNFPVQIEYYNGYEDIIGGNNL